MNNAILCLDIASCLAVVAFSKLIFKSLKHPIFLICAWWNVWLMISNIIVIGDRIQLGTHLVFLSFIYSILGFGIIFHRNVRPALFSIPEFLLRYRSAWISGAIFIYLLTICLGAYGYHLQKYYTDFRLLSYGTGDYSSLLYGSYYVQSLASFVLTPLVLVGCIALPVAGVVYANHKFLLLGLFFSAAADMQNEGRFNSYYYLLAIVLTAIIVPRKIPWLNIVLLAAVIMAGVVIVDTSKTRMQEQSINADVLEATENMLIRDHLTGFYLFDRDFSDDESKLHQGTSFGRLSLLAFPDVICCMILRRAGFSVEAEIVRMGDHWQNDMVTLGYEENGQPIVINAFYTSLYPIYYDFGYLGVVLVPGLFVYFLVVDYRTYLRRPNFMSMFVVIFLTIFFFTSIFNAKISSNDFEIILYCIFFRGIFLKESRTGVFRSRDSRAGRQVGK